MITTTLANLPGGRDYEVLGVVIGITHVLPGSNAQEAARRQLESQAERMGADGIVDVRLQMQAITANAPGRSTGLAIALIGTAIKFSALLADAPYVAG